MPGEIIRNMVEKNMTNAERETFSITFSYLCKA